MTSRGWLAIATKALPGRPTQRRENPVVGARLPNPALGRTLEIDPTQTPGIGESRSRPRALIKFQHADHRLCHSPRGAKLHRYLRTKCARKSPRAHLVFSEKWRLDRSR